MEFLDIIMKNNLQIFFRQYGIEGTEQKLKEVYANCSNIKDKYLEIYNQILKGE